MHGASSFRRDGIYGPGMRTKQATLYRQEGGFDYQTARILGQCAL
jgi:hypothetical protein